MMGVLYIAPTKTEAREILQEMLRALEADDIEGYWLEAEKLKLIHAALGK